MESKLKIPHIENSDPGVLTAEQKQALQDYYEWIGFEAWDADTVKQLLEFMPETMLAMAIKIKYAIQHDEKISQTERDLLNRFVF